MQSEEYQLIKTGYLPDLLSVLNLSGRSVLDFNVNNGLIARLVLKMGAKALVGFAPSRNPRIDDERLTLIKKAISTEDAELFSPRYAVISQPREEDIDAVIGVLEGTGIRDAILIVPEDRAQELEALGFSVALTFSHDHFKPVPVGYFIAMKRGF